MKNLGIKLSNQELLNLKGGAYFTCQCESSGGEYSPEADTLAEAEATLAWRCAYPGPGDFCEEDIPN